MNSTKNNKVIKKKVKNEGIPNKISVSFNLKPEKKVVDAKIITDKIPNKKD